jgi:hypothetical protein
MCIITFSWFTIVAKQGGHVGPLGAATYTLASLKYISTPTIVSIVGMCVNGYKLTKYLTFQNQQKKYND